MFNIYHVTKSGERTYYETWPTEEAAHKQMLALTGFDKDAEVSKRKDWYEVVEEI